MFIVLASLLSGQELSDGFLKASGADKMHIC